jgi:hypothetical protein
MQQWQLPLQPFYPGKPQSSRRKQSSQVIYTINRWIQLRHFYKTLLGLSRPSQTSTIKTIQKHRQSTKSTEDAWRRPYELTKSSHFALYNTIDMLELLFSKEAEKFLSDLSNAEEKVWISIGDAPTGEPQSESRKKELRQFFEFYVRLALCSKEQFREGKNLHGTRFSACVKSELSGSLIWGVQ